MILNYVCTQDKTVFQTTVGKEANLLGVWIHCPKCRNQISIQNAIPEEYSNIKLTPHELFSASQGFGLPAEKDFSEENIRRLLSSPIVFIELEDPTENRILINSITVRRENTIEDTVDEFKLHFGSSTKGAAIYRISKVENAKQER